MEINMRYNNQNCHPSIWLIRLIEINMRYNNCFYCQISFKMPPGNNVEKMVFALASNVTFMYNEIIMAKVLTLLIENTIKCQCSIFIREWSLPLTCNDFQMIIWRGTLMWWTLSRLWLVSHPVKHAVFATMYKQSIYLYSTITNVGSFTYYSFAYPVIFTMVWLKNWIAFWRQLWCYNCLKNMENFR